MTVATSVSVDERTKARLERLQERIERETGRAVSQQELLARLVEREFGDRDAVVDSFREDAGDSGAGDTVPGEYADEEFEGLSEEEKARWLSGTSDWGFETTEEEIDEVLYGSPDEFAEDAAE